MMHETIGNQPFQPRRVELTGPDFSSPASSFILHPSSFLPAAFTLIEVMLAIAIMAVICGTIYQFTGTVIRSSSVSMRTDAQEQSFGGLRRLLDTQFAALPTNETGTFVGVSEEGEHGHHDALRVVCPAGNAVLTPDAHGLYRVTLGLHELPKGSGHYTLVMEREPWDENENANGAPLLNLGDISAGGFKTSRNSLPSDSVRLLDGVRSLELAYYDPRLNSWQDKWNDDTLIPSLVRVRLEMENSGAPYEFVAQVPSGGIRRGLPTTNNALTYAPPGTLSVPGNGAGTVPGAVGPSGATVPSLPAGLTVPPPPPGGFTVPPMPPSGVPNGFPNQPLSFPNAPPRGGGPR